MVSADRVGVAAENGPPPVPWGGADSGALLGVLPQGVILLGSDGRVVDCNPAAEQLLGVPSQTLAGSGLVPAGWHLVRDDGTPLAEEDHPARLTLRTGLPQRDELVGVRRVDDSVVWLSISTAPLDVSGSAGCRQVVCSLVDVSERRQQARALLAREAQLVKALESAPFSLWSADVRGRLSFVAGAPGAEASQRVALIGQPAADLFPDAPEFGSHLQRALAGEGHAALVRRGSRALETRFYPTRDAEGGIDGVSGISIDVTARVTAEAARARLQDALRHASQEWRATFDAIDSPLLLIGADGTVRRVNRATRELWAQPFEKIVGSRLPEREQRWPWADVSRAAEQCRRSGRAVTLQARDDAGESYWDITASLVGEPGATCDVIVLARDVSGLVALRASLSRRERLSMIGELVGGVAHQVRNRLFGISSTLDACDNEHGRVSGVRDYLKVLRGELALLSRLTTHLVEYGRVGADTREPTSLSEVVASAASSCRAEANAAEVTVVATLPDDLPLLPLDPPRLQRAFQNLIENAVQHSPRGGQVRVSVCREIRQNRAVIVCDIDDDGPGFRAGDERHLFEPFFSRRRGGTGLGMAIAQRIVQEHGGRIGAGDRPGGGARLTIEIPVSPGSEGETRG